MLAEIAEIAEAQWAVMCTRFQIDFAGFDYDGDGGLQMPHTGLQPGQASDLESREGR